MKNALILHGTGATPASNWFIWLKNSLEEQGYQVWLPQLPNSDHPEIKKYVKYLTKGNFEYNDQTVLIGHSSDAVASLGLLENLQTKPRATYLVSAFEDNLGWDALDGLFTKPLNFPKIKQKSRKFVFIHSDNDPYCPLVHAKRLSNMMSGELLILKNQGHFNTENSPKYKKFPKLLELIKYQ